MVCNGHSEIGFWRFKAPVSVYRCPLWIERHVISLLATSCCLILQLSFALEKQQKGSSAVCIKCSDLTPTLQQQFCLLKLINQMKVNSIVIHNHLKSPHRSFKSLKKAVSGC